MIAALFVQARGCYSGLEGVDPWDEARDARLYAGPWPVVAHPPCARWCRLAGGAFGRKATKERGDDGGMFASALASVRRFGGVLEHPAGTWAWRVHGIVCPPREGGWVRAGDMYGGVTCWVEQGHYGHRTRKATWLYACGVTVPELTWGKSHPDGYEPGRSAGEIYTRLSKRQRSATPIPFRDLLISMARTAIRP